MHLAPKLKLYLHLLKLIGLGAFGSLNKTKEKEIVLLLMANFILIKIILAKILKIFHKSTIYLFIIMDILLIGYYIRLSCNKVKLLAG